MSSLVDDLEAKGIETIAQLEPQALAQDVVLELLVALELDGFYDGILPSFGRFGR